MSKSKIRVEHKPQNHYMSATVYCTRTCTSQIRASQAMVGALDSMIWIIVQIHCTVTSLITEEDTESQHFSPLRCLKCTGKSNTIDQLEVTPSYRL